GAVAAEDQGEVGTGAPAQVALLEQVHDDDVAALAEEREEAIGLLLNTGAVRVAQDVEFHGGGPRPPLRARGSHGRAARSRKRRRKRHASLREEFLRRVLAARLALGGGGRGAGGLADQLIKLLFRQHGDAQFLRLRQLAARRLAGDDVARLRR